MLTNESQETSQNENGTELSSKWVEFLNDINKISAEIQHSTGVADLRHLKKMELWGRLATVIGYLTAWIPNPFSPVLIAIGNYARWALIFHPISHGALDKVPGIAKRYTSGGFAVGYRRFIDWADWIIPRCWHDEHNILHHSYTGTQKDPDIVSRNTAILRSFKAPLFIRYILAFVIACTWKAFYYAPNVLVESEHFRGKRSSNLINGETWNPMKKEGFKLWSTSLLPYFLLRFVLIPLLYFPLGKTAMLSVLATSLLAEFLANFYSFATIATNHTGEDVPTFEGAPKNKAEFYLRQIQGTINFPTGSDQIDFFYGGMNYQIEHHVWPKASLLQYQKARPKLQALCQKYEIPYKVEALLPRILVVFKVMVGDEKSSISHAARSV